MTFIDIVTAMVIISLFIIGFSQAFLPAYNAWTFALKEYRTAKAIYFIKETFEQECAKPYRSMENWRNTVLTVRELENYEITELYQDDTLWALKLACFISGEYLEIIGVCTP